MKLNGDERWVAPVHPASIHDQPRQAGPGHQALGDQAAKPQDELQQRATKKGPREGPLCAAPRSRRP